MEILGLDLESERPFFKEKVKKEGEAWRKKWRRNLVSKRHRGVRGTKEKKGLGEMGLK